MRAFLYYAQEIIEWLQKYYKNDGGIFLLFAIVAFAYLFITQKNLRYKFLLPIAGMMLIVLNPILYKNFFIEMSYWRLFWVFPGTLLIVTAVIILMKSVKKPWLKYGILGIAVVIILFRGSNVFEKGGFSPRKNWEGLSEETLAVSDILLSIDESPRAIVHSDINTEIRQYAPEIALMYGRDAANHGLHFIRDPEPTALSVYLALEKNPTDFEYVLQVAVEEGYNFIVVKSDAPIDAAVLSQYGFSEVGRTENHIIYYKDK